MFAISDMITIEVLEAGIENLRNHPEHLEFILGGYHQSKFLRKLHGSNYIRQFRDWINKNEIKIQPYYAPDTNVFPNISVTATYSESEQFLGDYGQSSAHNLTVASCLAHFDASELTDDLLELRVSNSYNLQRYAAPGKILANDEFMTEIEYVVIGPDYTSIRTKEAMPRTLADWKIQDPHSVKKITVDASLNQTSVFIKVKSAGDVELHKLLCMVVRYCLKYGRLHFDSLGLMVPTFSQEMMVLEDPDQSIYSSVFTITGRIGDSWIISEEIIPTTFSLGLVADPVTADDQNVTI